MNRGVQAVGIAASVAAGLAGLATAGWRTASRRSLPQYTGQLHAPGLVAPVEIVRDHWGVPHIYAQNNGDLFFAQGYTHAQDRLWQMDLQRRTGHGQLAEIFGPVALESDRFIRTLGFSRIARQEVNQMAKEEYEAVVAYCNGVNHYLASNRRHLPVECTLLRYCPTPWEPADIYVFGKIMALNLSMNWTMELLRTRIVDAVGAARAALLDPTYPDEQPFTIPPDAEYQAGVGTSALHAATELDRFSGGRDGLQGSNAWVVSGARTKSGSPLLANDPHLALQMPALWYENHLVGGDYAVTGASIPGTVGVIIGHNARIAWGVTNGMNDVQDLYLEQFDPADPAGLRYNVAGQWAEATLVNEAIIVRDRPLRQRTHIVNHPVRITRHGPVISPLDTDEAGQPEQQALALQWTALQPSNLQRTVLAINRATDWDSFRTALVDWVVPTQNFVYADISGQIGYALGGALPVRAQGDGRLPVPGWTNEWEWQGTVPSAENPHQQNPASGYVVTANNRISAETTPGEWLPGYRATRIRDRLLQVAQHDVGSFARLQNDQFSIPGRFLSELARTEQIPVVAGDQTGALVRSIMAAWDGQLTADCIGGLIATTLEAALVNRAYRELTASLSLTTGQGLFASLPAETYLHRALPRVLALFTPNGDQAWLAPGDTPEQILADAWQATLSTLYDRWGTDPRRWRYGKAHRFTLHHPLGALGPLGRYFNRGAFATGGDLNTVCVGSLSSSPTGAESYVAPSYRQICDLSNWDNSCSCYPGGQCGNPASPHYADLVQPWLDGRYHPILWSPTAVQAATAATLTLLPAATTEPGQ